MSACGAPANDEAPYTRPAELDGVRLSSGDGGSPSHQAGENCMACHSAASDAPERAGPGLFTVASTVWRSEGEALVPLPGATIELRTAPFGGGELVLAIPTDAQGNAFTTEPVGFFGQSLFPHVVLEGRSVSMPFPTNSGACNMCHHTGGLEIVVP